MDLSTFTDPQARATIEAARIGADAAIHAAWIQATAAAGALAAGVLAYIGAVRQVRLQERAQEVRALAYRFRLLRVVEEYHEQVARACAVAEGQLAAFRSGSASVAITSFQLVKPRMLHDDNWEAHALLGRRAVELILTIDDLSLRLAQFDQADPHGRDAHRFQFCKRHDSPARREGSRAADARAGARDHRLRAGARPAPCGVGGAHRGVGGAQSDAPLA